jgi:hypothetical protein
MASYPIKILRIVRYEVALMVLLNVRVSWDVAPGQLSIGGGTIFRNVGNFSWRNIPEYLNIPVSAGFRMDGLLFSESV